MPRDKTRSRRRSGAGSAKPGPKAGRLQIDGPWEEAVERALKKGPPEPEEEKKKGGEEESGPRKRKRKKKLEGG